MIASAALPNVAFRSADTVGPVDAPASSVATPST